MAENGYKHLRRDYRSVAGGILDARGLDDRHLGKIRPIGMRTVREAAQSRRAEFIYFSGTPSCRFNSLHHFNQKRPKPRMWTADVRSAQVRYRHQSLLLLDNCASLGSGLRLPVRAKCSNMLKPWVIVLCAPNRYMTTSSRKARLRPQRYTSKS